jgi:hypothetical protein
LPFLDEIHENAQKIGAINTIAIQNGKKKAIIPIMKVFWFLYKGLDKLSKAFQSS